MSAIVVTGTDTGVGKTVFAHAQNGALAPRCGKPLQAGQDEERGAAAQKDPPHARKAPGQV
ncbi:MAG: hypothetical protein FP826_00030, partial [Sphingomonadales bacterium]|nr:hypothetical protein [Sphingomonadales bacterium]